MRRHARRWGAGLAAAVLTVLWAAGGLLAGVPEQFTVWGKLGKEIKWRTLSTRQVEKMQKEGKTAEQIAHARKNYDARHWPEVQAESEKPPTVFTNEETERGWVLFGRHYMDRVYYYTVPAAYERLRDLKAFAARGEYEPLTFSVHALKDLERVSAAVTDLAGPAGATLAKDFLDVRVVRCYPTPYTQPWWDPDGRDPQTKLPRKRMIPLVMESRPAVSIPKGRTRQFWITLKVPADCRPGVYRGKVVISVGPALHEVPLSVRVLPFALMRLDKGAYLSGVVHDRDAFIDYREHGFNVIGTGINLPRPMNRAVRDAFDKFHKTGDKTIQPPLPDAEEVYRLNRDKFDASLKLAAETRLELRTVKFGFWTWFVAGWTGKWFKYFPISEQLDARYAGVVSRMVAHAKRRGVREFIVLPGDEPGGHPETMPEILHYLELVKKRCPGARTGMTVGGGMSMGMDEVGKLGPHLDVVVTNYLDGETIRRVRKAGKSLWIYNGGSGTADPQRDRYAYGFYSWKVGADGMLQWVYRWGDTYRMAYRGVGDCWAYVFLSAEGKPLPTIHYEAMREAFDDQRYGVTLSRLIEIAEADGGGQARKGAARARAVIKDVLDAFEVNYMKRSFPDSVFREFHVNSLDAEAFDRFRWRLAVEIMDLQQALGAKAKLDPARAGVPLIPQ